MDPMQESGTTAGPNEEQMARPTERFRWFEPAHALGENRLMVESDALRQALVWQVAAELIRRHPKTLRLHMADIHQYGPALIPMQFNRHGQWQALHLMTWGKGMHITPCGQDWSSGRFNWLDVLLTPDRRTYVVEQLERQAGLTPPTTTPPTASTTIGARFVAAFMAKTALAPALKWLAVNGLVEDDEDRSPANELFEAMPAVQTDWSRRDLEEEWSTSRYWFLLPYLSEWDSDPANPPYPPPVAAIDFVTGTLWTPDGKHRDLMSEYSKHGRHIDALVSRHLPPTQ